MEQIITKYFWAFNLLTLALVAYLVADGSSEIVALKISGSLPHTAIAEPPTSTQSAKSDIWTPPDGEPILRRNIFDSTVGPLDRIIPDPDEAPKSPEMNTGELPLVACSGSSVTLLATVASRYHPEWSFASISEGKKNKLCRVGDSVNSRVVSGITWRYLFLRGSTDECYIDMFDDGSAAKVAKKPTKKSKPGANADIEDGIKKISDTERQVDRAVVDKLLSDPTQFLKSVRVRPYRKDGKIAGYKLRRFTPGSPLALLGAKKGDIIHSVNGTKLTSVDQALNAYQSLRSNSELTFSITRKGKPMDLKISVR
jgi:type II secretion system protein C